jgi:hypothetical protein
MDQIFKYLPRGHELLDLLILLLKRLAFLNGHSLIWDEAFLLELVPGL